MKDAQIVYPIYMELSKRFHLGLLPCGELESLPIQADAGMLLHVQRWFRAADTQIEVHHIRELLTQIYLSGEVLHALLARHLGKESKDRSDRDKIDFLLVRYLAECLPSNIPAHNLSFEQVAEVLRPVLGGTITPKRVSGLEDCIQDLERCHTLGDFVDQWILERGHALKVAAHEKAFDPTTLVAFTHFSFLLRLGSIRVLREDIQTLEDDLKELENKGVTEMDVDSLSVDFSEKQSIGELRKCCEEWKRYFPEKYSQNQWFTDVIRLRSNVKQALGRLRNGPGNKSTQEAARAATRIVKREQAAAPEDSLPSGHAPIQGMQLQAEVERYIHEIAEQVQSPIGGRASSVTAIELAGLRLMLSTGEVDAFQEPFEGVSLVLQHAVAARAILLTALDKPDTIGLRAAVDLAQSEISLLQEQITVAQETGDTDTAVNLTACFRSLRKALEKMDKVLLSCSGKNFRAPQAQQPKQQPKGVEHS